MNANNKIDKISFELFNLYPKKPKKLLEIGCFEGMATTWLCNNILEDGAEYDVIDTFEETFANFTPRKQFELIKVETPKQPFHYVKTVIAK